nr:hypothetical protein [Candidatus Sigynarchaeum springense]
MSESTSIPIRKETRNRLKTLGQKGETYDEIIGKLIEIAEQVDFFNKQKRILEDEEFIPLDRI